MSPAPAPIACDASVVFNLGHRGQLEALTAALKAAGGLLITPEVEREVTRDPHDGFYDAFLKAHFTRCDEPLTALAEIPAEYAPMLGDGERSVLALARQRQCLAAIDDSLGRKAAKAMGLEDLVGTLEPGKQADIACIDLGQIETQPLHHVISQVVYATGRNQVSDVWIAGKPKLRGRILVDMDLGGILANARQWQARIGAVKVG